MKVWNKGQIIIALLSGGRRILPDKPEKEFIQNKIIK